MGETVKVLLRVLVGGVRRLSCLRMDARVMSVMEVRRRKLKVVEEGGGVRVEEKIKLEDHVFTTEAVLAEVESQVDELFLRVTSWMNDYCYEKISNEVISYAISNDLASETDVKKLKSLKSSANEDKKYHKPIKR